MSSKIGVMDRFCATFEKMKKKKLSIFMKTMSYQETDLIFEEIDNIFHMLYVIGFGLRPTVWPEKFWVNQLVDLISLKPSTLRVNFHMAKC